jgi:hypothetical protein
MILKNLLIVAIIVWISSCTREFTDNKNSKQTPLNPEIACHADFSGKVVSDRGFLVSTEKALFQGETLTIDSNSFRVNENELRRLEIHDCFGQIYENVKEVQVRFDNIGNYSIFFMAEDSLGSQLADTLRIHVYKAPSISAFSGKQLAAYEANLDANGIPLGSGGEYHPSIIARYVLDLYLEYHNNPSAAVKAKILNSANWLTANLKPHGAYSSWDFDFDFPSMGMTAPWASSLTNAWGSAALVYAAYLDPTRREEYLSKASSALNFIFTPVEDGGGLGHWADGSIWFEEYPLKTAQSHVLNGNIFILDILDMFYDVFNADSICDYVAKDISSLESKIDTYDVDYGSVYDARFRANKLGSSYHSFHWLQLAWLYQRSNIQKFREISLKWYELDYQSQSTATASSSIDPVNYGPSRLADNVYWYGYWSNNRFPVTLTFKIDKPREIRGINLFCPTGDVEVGSFHLYYVKDGTQISPIQDDGYIVFNAGYNITDIYETTVKTIIMSDTIVSDEIQIVIDSPKMGDVVALREVGIWKDMSQEYNTRINEIRTALSWDSRIKLCQTPFVLGVEKR